MRALVDIPEDDIQKLDVLAKCQGKSRAAEIREAIKLYLVHHADNNEWIERGRGFWKDRNDVSDGLEYQETIRANRALRPEL